MSEGAMVMTVLEAQVSQSQWSTLQTVFAKKTTALPPGLVHTYLVQSRADGAVWKIVTLWESQRALDRMRSSGETPGGVLIFRAALAEPQLSVHGIQHHAGR